MKREMLSLLVGMLALILAERPVIAGELSVNKTVTLKGSPEATWSLVGDFCGLASWDPGVAKCEIASGANNRAGAVRRLTLGDGATMTEQLVAHDATRRIYSYKILESPLPVVSYLATITVLSGPDGGSVVAWKSTFKAATGTDDGTARGTIEQIYEDGFRSLQARDVESTTRALVEAATAAFHQALRTNDAETLFSFVADEVVMMPPGEAAVRGKSAMRTWYAAFLSQFRTSSLTLADREVFIGTGSAVELGTYEWGLTPAAGGDPIIDRGSYMQVWRLQSDGHWRFASEIWNSAVPATSPSAPVR